MRFLVLTLLLSVPCAAQATWTVHSAGGAQFTAIQPAIAAAAAGDRIEVQGAGPYAGFVVDRGVEVESLGGAVCGTIEVLGVPAGQRARVAGFVVDQGSSSRVRVAACAGAVVLASLAHTGASAGNGAMPGLEVLDAPQVLVDRCSLRGQWNAAGAPGARLVNAQAMFVEGSLLGGVSVSSFPSSGNSGRSGLEVDNSHVTLRGTTVRGGAATGASIAGGSGGDALHVVSGTALVLGQCQLRGEPGGGGGIVSGSHGAAARGNVRYTPDTLLVGPTVNATAILTRPVVASPANVMVGTTLSWSLSGLPNQPVWLGLDLAFAYLPLPQFDSALVLTPGAALLPVQFFDATGGSTASLAIPNSAALRHLDLVAQAASFIFGGLILTAPTVTHTL